MIFTTFLDIARFLYANLVDTVKRNYRLNSALIVTTPLKTELT